MARQAEKFLAGAWDMDKNFRDAPFRENLPVMLGLLSVWNVSFLDLPARAILPYCQVRAYTNPFVQQTHLFAQSTTSIDWSSQINIYEFSTRL